jgi:peptidase E
MKLFLTSNIGGIKKVNGEKIPVNFLENNKFLYNLKKSLNTYNKFVLVASNPNNYEQNDEFLNLDIKALELSGFKFKEYLTLDYRNKDNIKNTLDNSSLILLCGGNTYQQNLFFNDINLKKYLEDLDCCIVGISAGAINSAKVVFNSPEKEEDFKTSFILNGLNLTNINIEPHFDKENNNKIKMNAILEESYNRNVYGIQDGSYILDNVVYGKCYKIHNGEITLICENEQIISINE